MVKRERFQPKRAIIKCEKCGGRIKVGDEVKVGVIRKKYFHTKCYEQVKK